jgi:hypothetical protein
MKGLIFVAYMVFFSLTGCGGAVADADDAGEDSGIDADYADAGDAGRVVKCSIETLFCDGDAGCHYMSACRVVSQ